MKNKDGAITSGDGEHMRRVNEALGRTDLPSEAQDAENKRWVHDFGTEENFLQFLRWRNADNEKSRIASIQEAQDAGEYPKSSPSPVQVSASTEEMSEERWALLRALYMICTDRWENKMTSDECNHKMNVLIDRHISSNKQQVSADIEVLANQLYPEIENVGFDGENGYANYLNATYTRGAERKAFIAGAQYHPGLADILLKALEKISNWELPSTGKFWDKEMTKPTSYEVEYGSNGARQYIKSVASKALTAYRESQTKKQ